MNTAKILTREWVENFIGNSHIIASLPHISEVSFKGPDTAVLVAPGPSLNKNIHLLKELDGKALIVSVLHALPR